MRKSTPEDDVKVVPSCINSNDGRIRPGWDASVVKEYEARTEKFTELFIKDMLEPFFQAEEHTNKDPTVESTDMIPTLIDVGCGAGCASLLAAEMGFYVTATDLSKDMVRRTLQRAEERNLLESIQGIVADGQELSSCLDTFNQKQQQVDSYDYAIAAFSVIFFHDPAKGLQEIYNCLGHQGKVVLSAWGNEEETPAFQVFPDAFRALTDPGHWQHGKPDRITGSASVLTSLLTKAGFQDIQVVGPVSHTVHVVSPEAFYDRFALTSPKIRSFLSQLEPNTVEEIKSKVKELAIERGGQEDGSIAIPSKAYLAYGTKV